VKSWYSIFSPLLAIGLLAGCGGSREVGLSPSITVADLSALPKPQAADFISTDGYGSRVRPFDRLAVQVLNAPELERELEVEADGTLYFPLIGAVETNDMTPAQIARKIEDKLRGRFILEPSVTVTFEERLGQTFSITGEVTKPGQYVLPPETTLLEAVAVGGGLSEFADLDDVIVIREVDGSRYIAVYNLRAIQRGNYDDPDIFARDIVVVGDSPNRRLLDTLVGVAPLLTNAVFLVDRIGQGQ